jgi:antiphage defense system Thoeris ThsA-like protein
MLEKLSKEKLSVVLAVVGSVFLLAALFDVQDITKLQITRASAINWLSLLVGVVLTATAVGLHFFDELSGSWITKRRVTKIPDGFQIDLSGTRVAVHFGRLEEFPVADGHCAVVLPANEFFDDECVRDDRSALGAFMKKNFPIQIPEIQQLIFDGTKSFPPTDVEKEDGVVAKSFGVGRCVFLDKPLNSTHRFVVAAVTTKRARVGLRSEVGFIFSVVSELQRLVADKRLRGLVIPVLGAGHGGLKIEMALFALVLALSEAIGRDPARHLQSVDIVVFKPDNSKKPQIKPSTVKRILGSASAMLE